MNCPHGIWVDTRDPANPRVLVADRANVRLQYFTLDGKFLRVVDHDLLCPCHFDQRGTDLMIPDLRGRIAYDVRFEVYDKEFFRRLADYNWEQGPEWKSFADGYRIIVVDETNRSHTADFLKEPGTRVIYRNDELTIVARPTS